MSVSSIAKLSKISWEFKDAKTRTATHGYHPFHAKFIPQIPSTLIEHLTNEGDNILDPFCGSGTTLIESNILKRNSIGIDISPLATLISEVKTTFIDPEVLLREYKLLKLMIEERTYNSVIPDFPNKNIWFNTQTLKELGNIWGQILTFEDSKKDIFNFFKIALSSILKTVANRSEHWNWAFIGDNILPKIDKYMNPNKYLYNTIEYMIEGMKEFKSIKSEKEMKVIYGNTKDVSNLINNEIDLIITSPPYCFAVDFNRYYRLSYYWFGWKINENRDIEIGARSKRAKKNGINDYFSDMEICVKEFYKVLKDNKYCCFTLGNTKRDNEEIKAVERTIEMCLKEGFKLIEHTYREISKQSMAQKRIPKEAVLIFKK